MGFVEILPSVVGLAMETHWPREGSLVASGSSNPLTPGTCLPMRRTEYGAKQIRENRRCEEPPGGFPI